MAAGPRDTLITFEAQGEGVSDPLYGPQPGTWSTFSQAWADVQDVLPSRAESIDDDISMARRPSRIRVEYFDGINVTSDMRIDIDGRKLRIISGPAMKGKRKEWEVMAEELSTDAEDSAAVIPIPEPDPTTTALWFDLSDNNVVWQDAGSTEPAGFGNPIARIDDRSPNNFPVLAPAGNETERFLSGSVWSSGSVKSPSWLYTPVQLDTNIPEFWLWGVCQSEPAGTILSLDGTDFQYVRLDHDQVFVRGETGAGNPLILPIAPFTAMTAFLIRMRQSDRTVTVFRNGVQEAQAILPGGGWFGTLANFVMHAASIDGSSTSNSYIAQCGVSLAHLTAQKQSDLNRYLVAKGRVVL